MAYVSPYDVMAKYGNAPSRSQIYRRSNSGQSVHYKNEKPVYPTFLERIRSRAGVVERTPSQNAAAIQKTTGYLKQDMLKKKGK